MKTIPLLSSRLLFGIIIGLRVLSIDACGTEISKKPVCYEIGLAYIDSLEWSVALLEQADKVSRKAIVEDTLMTVFKLWMSERNLTEQYPNNFFKGIGLSLNRMCAKAGMTHCLKDPLGPLLRGKSNENPIIDVEFGRVPRIYKVSELASDSELYKKLVNEFLSDLGIQLAMPK